MVDDIIKACQNPKLQLAVPIVALVAVLFFTFAAFDYSIMPYVVYPEEEYQLLEEEAEKMLAQDSFDSQYVDTIEYEPKNDILRVKLNTANATVQMNFSEYGEENQSVDVQRLMGKVGYFVMGIMTILRNFVASTVCLIILLMMAFKILEHVCLKIQRRHEN